MLSFNMRQIFSLLRPNQWIKNLLIFVPAFFEGSILTWPDFLASARLFCIFCVVASLIYVINDVSDWKEDSQHPTKKHRPIASSAVKISEAVFICCLLIAVSIVAFFAGLISNDSWLLLLLYFVVNLSYSLYLKNTQLLEMVLVASGFGIRVAAGTTEIETLMSPWLLMCIFSGSLMIVTAKRLNDLRFAKDGQKMRSVFSQYSIQFLEKQLVFLAGTFFVIYLLFIFSDYGMEKFGPWLPLSGIPALLWLQRFMQLVFVFNEGGDPTTLISRDLGLIACKLVLVAMFSVMLYSYG